MEAELELSEFDRAYYNTIYNNRPIEFVGARDRYDEIGRFDDNITVGTDQNANRLFNQSGGNVIGNAVNMPIESILIWILLGVIFGWLASLVVRGFKTTLKKEEKKLFEN